MGINIHVCVGGTDARVDQRALKSGGIHVVVGTPGRINHMMTK
jgi:superfamily II DNA/RNA helicase